MSYKLTGAPYRVGLVGCGDISDTYFRNAPLFCDFTIAACASRRMETARRKAEQYDIDARPIDELISSDDIDVVLNLTTPDAHADISLASLEAGKHVYSEKPIGISLDEGFSIDRLAQEKGLRVGCAPDTFLGAAIQTARNLIADGTIGRPSSGTAAFMSRGFENLHPQPDFFFQKGGGPVLDMGPYYLTALVVLLGPITSVQATGRRERAERAVTNPRSPRFGDVIKVEVLTSVHALINFRGGQQITFLASWDVWRHGLPPIEIHGSEGSLRLPDPDWFGGDPFVARGDRPFEPTRTSKMIYGRPNQDSEDCNQVANYRGLGLADMTRAIAESRPHRASLGLALHTLAVMNGILEAVDRGETVAIAVDCDIPQPLLEHEARSLLAGVVT